MNLSVVGAKLPPVLTKMDQSSRDIQHCRANLDTHLDGICSVVEETIGWNYPDVIRTLRSQCPDGTQVAVSDNKVIGVCIVTPLDDKEAFVSVLGVRSTHRRRGVATTLFRECEKALGDRNITLYSDVDAIQFYQSVGFKLAEMPSVVYFATLLPKLGILLESEEENHIQIVPLQSVPFDDIHNYDKSIANMDRNFWLRLCYDQKESVAAVDANNKVCGYGGLSPVQGENAFRLQPILAENPKIAKKILVSLLKKIPESGKIVFKVPKENVEGVELMKQVGLDVEKCLTGIVMYTKHQVKVPVHKVFSLTNGMNQVA